ncbi:MAG TPA: isochorismatase family protein [Fimbriimonas sp.]|nr:isochorismatase family protein [Fimbriimonas sp.]
MSSKPVLAVIDVQVGSFKPHMQGLGEQIAEFAREWQGRGGSVLAFKYVNVKGSPCERFLDWREMYAPPETDLVESLSGFEQESVCRNVYSAVTPELKGLVGDDRSAVVCLVGIDTAACVQKTALDLFDAGIRPFVVEELCASGAGDSAHDAAIESLKRSIGLRQVGSREQAFRLLQEC